MHTLARNKTTIYYALCAGKTELTDEYGNRTGQYELTYSEPQAIAMNIRWNDGAVRIDGFGLESSARRRMVTDDTNCPIDIDSILWIGIEPNENGTVPHNYVVSSAPEKSLNHIVYYVTSVNVGIGVAANTDPADPLDPVTPITPIDPIIPIVGS